MNSISRFAVLAIAALTMPSCASITVEAIPQPGGADRPGYDIVLEFANVLNLPERAKVVMDGTTVGVVTDMRLGADKVDVTSRIDSGVVVPADIQAVLQQATVLGDLYVALERPAAEDPSSPALGPGAVIPLSQTASPPPLEDTIANLANFVASGSIQRAQNTIIGINRVHRTLNIDIPQMVSRVAGDIGDLANNIDVVDHWLNGLSGTADVMFTSIPSFQYWFSPDGMLGFGRGTLTSTYISTLLPAVGSVYSGGFWLVPLLNSLVDASGSIQQSKWAIEDEIPAWRNLFTDFYLPQDKYPAINITSITGPDGRELSGNVHDVLRMLGAVP